MSFPDFCPMALVQEAPTSSSQHAVLLMVNLRIELTITNDAAISTISRHCSQKKLQVKSCSTEILLLFLLSVFSFSKRSRDFLWGLGGGKKVEREVQFGCNTKHKRMKKKPNGCLFFLSSGNCFLFSSFEEKLGSSVLSCSAGAQAVQGLASLTTTLSHGILYLDGLESLSFSPQHTPVSASASSLLMPMLSYGHVKIV